MKSLLVGAKNGKTTAFAAVSLALALLNAAKLILDGDPATEVDWNITAVAVANAVGLFFSRDADKSSKNLNLPGA